MSERKRAENSTHTSSNELQRLECENGILRAVLGEHVEAWTQLLFGLGQRHLEREVRATLAENLRRVGGL